MKNCCAGKDVEMPVVRLGTGGYGSTKNKSCPIQPEHWNVSEGEINAQKWLSVGGTGFDSANGYESKSGVAADDIAIITLLSSV